ncbi:MAG: ArsR family transcriptional regulator [Lachnospiraceae bacterium]|nr:ArsR family transcriptional regulator [Lachnospiraceae bacterium]
MYHLHSLTEAEEVFKALSTPMRIRIMELIAEKDMSMNDLAVALDLTNSAISMHVAKLEAAGLVYIETTSGRRGSTKIVKPKHHKLYIEMSPHRSEINSLFYEDSISIGHFSSVEAHPTCGLSTTDNIIGELDDPRVFYYPERFNAGVIWIGYGSITYDLPNRLKAGQKIDQFQISFEISSECPETNDDYPSDIYFYINDKPLGKWISPGDFGARKGYMSPHWWPPLLNQYGLLKTLIINDNGTFIDGTHKISETTIKDLMIDYNSTISFRFEVPKDTANCGGLTLFGKGFGDYDQNIIVKMFYSDNA